MKDARQKSLLCRHFGAEGWYVQVEVPVFHRGGMHEQGKVITDIDVLALRARPDLRWETILGDCKTLRGQSPANRAIWLRGLMDYFGASAGIVILKPEQHIEVDHKLFAASLGITLLHEAEFSKYDRALVYPDGSADYPLSYEALTKLRGLPRRYTKLRVFCKYLYELAWNEDSRLDLIRTVIGEGRAVAQEIDPAKREHLALVLDATGLFAVGLAECVGSIFNQYLHPGSLNQLDDALKVLIWGGRAKYDFSAALRRDLMKAKGMKPGPQGALALPVWDKFLQLVRNMLEHPRLAFSVPRLLRTGALDIVHDRPFLCDTNHDDLLLIKYAMLASSYFCRAAKLPPQSRTTLEAMFTQRQTELVHPEETQTDSSPHGPLLRPPREEEGKQIPLSEFREG